MLFAKSSAGQAGKAEFEAAAKAALNAAAPGANIVQEIEVKDRQSGQTDIGNALQGHPDLAGVMASTDEGALGAIGAFDAAEQEAHLQRRLRRQRRGARGRQGGHHLRLGRPAVRRPT